MKKVLSVLLAALLSTGTLCSLCSCNESEPPESSVSSSQPEYDPETLPDMESVNQLVKKSNPGKPGASLEELPKENKNLSELLEKTKLKEIILSDMGIKDDFIAAASVTAENNELIISQTLKSKLNMQSESIARTYIKANITRDHEKLNTCLYAKAISELITGSPEITLNFRWYNIDNLFLEEKFLSSDADKLIAEENSIRKMQEEAEESFNALYSFPEEELPPETSQMPAEEYDTTSIIEDPIFSAQVVNTMTGGYPFVVGSAAESGNKVVLRLYLQKEPDTGLDLSGEGYLNAFFNNGDVLSFAQPFGDIIYNQMNLRNKNITIVIRFFGTNGTQLGETVLTEQDF